MGASRLCLSPTGGHRAAASGRYSPGTMHFEVHRYILIKKREIRKLRQKTKHPLYKKQLNFLSKSLKDILFKERNEGIQEYLRNLDASAVSDYSLWKATKKN